MRCICCSGHARSGEERYDFTLKYPHIISYPSSQYYLQEFVSTLYISWSQLKIVTSLSKVVVVDVEYVGR